MYAFKERWLANKCLPCYTYICNTARPSLPISAPPPPTGPHIARTYYPLFFLVVLMSPMWWGLYDTLVPLDSTYGSPGPPKMKKKKHKFTYIFYMLLRGYIWCEIYFKMFVGPYSIYYIKCWVMLTHVFWFRATGPGGIHLRLRATEQSSYISHCLDNLIDKIDVKTALLTTVVVCCFCNKLSD